MSWPDPARISRSKLVRLCGALALAGLVAGCFQPLYGDRSPTGASEGVGDKLAGVSVSQIEAPNGSRIARVGNEVRDELIFDLTGGGEAPAPTHRLVIRLSSSETQVIVDIDTARPDIQNYGINASYALIDVATGKQVISGQTFARVSYNIPGQQQRFAGARGQRDAENRAAKVIAGNIRSRLASFFVTGA